MMLHLEAFDRTLHVEFGRQVSAVASENDAPDVMVLPEPMRTFTPESVGFVKVNLERFDDDDD